MNIHVTQYLLPDGRKRQTSCEIDDEIGKLVTDEMHFSAEILTTGQVVVYGNRKQDDDSFEECEICHNGPTDENGLSPKDGFHKVIKLLANRTEPLVEV